MMKAPMTPQERLILHQKILTDIAREKDYYNQLNEQDQLNQDLDRHKINRTLEKQQPDYSPVEWLNVFPSAKLRWGRIASISLKVIIISNKIEIDFLSWGIKQRVRLLYAGSNQKEIEESAWYEDYIREENNKKISQCRKNIRASEERLRYLRTIGRPAKPGQRIEITPDMVKRAKAYPIDKLIEINRAGFTKCFGHRDRNPNNAYTKGNFIYCFVCQKSWDTIAILMERDNYKFREAVMKLQ